MRSLVVPALAWVLSCAPALSQSEFQQAYRLGSGDEIRVSVFNHPDLSGEYAVSGEGAIPMPLIGTVELAGLTLSEAESLIEDKLQPDFLKNPDVTLEVMNYRPFYILGEVRGPGSYPYVAGMKVINAVALAGGYTYRARESKVKIERSVAGSTREIEASPETIVMPGDIIRVPERFF